MVYIFIIFEMPCGFRSINVMFGKIDLSPGNEILIYYLQNGRKKKRKQKGRGSKGSKNGLQVFSGGGGRQGGGSLIPGT